MAKKTTQGSRSTPKTRKNTGRTSTKKSSVPASQKLSPQNLKKFDFKKINSGEAKKLVRKVSKNPIALYIAGGIGTFFAARFAINYYKNHPEVKDFIKEYFDTVENTLKEYRGGIEEGEGTEARH